MMQHYGASTQPGGAVEGPQGVTNPPHALATPCGRGNKNCAKGTNRTHPSATVTYITVLQNRPHKSKLTYFFRTIHWLWGKGARGVDLSMNSSHSVCAFVYAYACWPRGTWPCKPNTQHEMSSTSLPLYTITMCYRVSQHGHTTPCLV